MANHLLDSTTLQLAVAQLSSAGIKPVNEDSVGIRAPQGYLCSTKGAVAVIADGLSCAEASREASQVCVQNFIADYYSTPESWSVKTSAGKVLTALNRWLCGQGHSMQRGRVGYLTTLSAAIFKSSTAYLFHVGDTRIYRLREGSLEQLTRDHCTYLNSQQSTLTRAMGMDWQLDIDYRSVDLQSGDIFLLSTDGVHGFIDDATLCRMLEQGAGDPDSLCQALIDTALARGSDDNLSCQVVRIDACEPEGADELCRRLSALPFPPLLKVGQVLDGLRIEAQMHASTRSELFRVTELSTGRVLAMKVPSANFEDDPAFIERFVMEGWIGARIDSPYVVRTLEPEGPRSCLYQLSEFISGETLAQHLARHGPCGVEQAIELITQVGRALQSLHRRETIHQDLKPDNLMITPEGRVVLVDFGSCRVAALQEIRVAIDPELVLGTAGYTAPEVRLGMVAQPRSDLFSLGVILYEVLSGQMPFGEALERAQTPADFARLRYVSVCRHNPMVPVWLDGAIRKALSVAPEGRYSDVAEFLHDLHHPNPLFMQREHAPLMERDPLRFWQGLSALLVLGNLITLYLLLAGGK